MPLVTGTLTDIGLEPLTGLSPRLLFTPSAPAVRVDGRVFASKPVEVVPAADGSFSVDLASTDGLSPRHTHWRLQVQFRASTSGAGGFTASDFLPFELFVPLAGGPIGDLIGDRVPFDIVYSDPSVPNESQRTATLQFNPVTGDLYERQA